MSMNMYEAILSRKTSRHFLQERIEWDEIADILDYANNLSMFVEGIAVEFKLVSNIEKKQGFYGPFSVNAPYYICLSSEIRENYLINAGYLLQQLSLYLTSKGYGSCYVGYATPGKDLKRTMKYDYVMALAFGKTNDSLYRASSEAKRLPEKDVVIYKENISPDVKQILNAARLAPSAMNSQPWRFVAFRKKIHIFCKKNVFLNGVMNKTKMLDIGIMLANLLVAADELWVDVSLVKSETIKQKQFQNNEYIITVKIG